MRLIRNQSLFTNSLLYSLLAHDGRMIDSVFLAYVLERYIREDLAYKIKNLRHVALADLKHEVSHYKVV